MVFKLYTIYDRVSGTYGAPFMQPNDGAAVRYFNNLMSNNRMVAFDCELYLIASFDSDTGCVTSKSKDFITKYVLSEDGGNE